MMAEEARFDALTRQLIRQVVSHTRAFYQKGWLPATSGNFSVRLPSGEPGHFAVTATGLHKGELEADALARQWSRREQSGQRLTNREPIGSSDTEIHAAIYRHLQPVGAVYHLHLPAATALAARRDVTGRHSTPDDPSALTMDWNDTIKAFAEWCDWSRGEPIACPVVPNGTARATAEWVDRRARAGRLGEGPPGLNVIDHGIYVWGGSPAEARRHAEAFGYLYELAISSTPPQP